MTSIIICAAGEGGGTEFYMTCKKPMMLLIMDGFGLNEKTYGNAIAQANKPHLDEIFRKYPMTRLDACGEAVGLPAGQMGNSEVGHLNIGAGRVIYQDLTRITKDAKSGAMFKNPVLLNAMETAKANRGALHIFGLLSDGGVHSHIKHLFSLLEMAKANDVRDVRIHCFLDGRDVPPRCAMQYIKQLEAKISELGTGTVATISGRYYSMDRDKRWDRIKLAYDAMTLASGRIASGAEEALSKAYENGENDEFVIPTVIMPDSFSNAGAPTSQVAAENTGCKVPDEPPAHVGKDRFESPGDIDPARKHITVNDGDSIIMYNFRPDRAREITRAFVDKDFDGFKREKTVSDLTYVCMTEYDASMPGVSIAYPPETYKNTLGEYVSSLGLRQLRIAETEKYAHVTFFFNGGAEIPNPGEDRILVPSPDVATYDLQPEMCAYEVTEKVIEAIEKDIYDMIILNFANADMVGHTGVFEAAVKAIETLDQCVPRIADAILRAGGQILLTADHGNADVMLDDDGNIVTSHSLKQVPLVHISNTPARFISRGKLSDIAPTMLTLMNLPVPAEMTGDVLVEI